MGKAFNAHGRHAACVIGNHEAGARCRFRRKISDRDGSAFAAAHHLDDDGSSIRKDLVRLRGFQIEYDPRDWRFALKQPDAHVFHFSPIDRLTVQLAAGNAVRKVDHQTIRSGEDLRLRNNPVAGFHFNLDRVFAPSTFTVRTDVCARSDGATSNPQSPARSSRLTMVGESLYMNTCAREGLWMVLGPIVAAIVGVGDLLWY